MPFDKSSNDLMKNSKTSKISRRKLLGASLASSAALVATATASRGATGKTKFKTTGADSMSLQEFRALNGEGSVARLMGSMDCDLLSMCHKRMKDEEGVWIPELVPVFEEIDARTHPKDA